MEYLVLIIMSIIAVGYIFKSSLSETDASKKQMKLLTNIMRNEKDYDIHGCVGKMGCLQQI